jgi:hypothetical protein
MPPPTESVVDEDVSGDDFHGGTTLAFGADDPVDGSPFTLSDSDRLAYMEDVFEASTDNVSVWKSVPYFPGRIETNGADNRMLQTMKSSVHPVLMKSCQLVNKQLPSMKPADFVSIFLNRDWYLMLLDYVNSRIDFQDQKATPQEILEVQRVWILQCIYSTTAKNLFNDASGWFTPIRRIRISYERFSFIFQKLGANLPTIDVNVGINDTLMDEVAEKVWGSFNQHNNIISRIETHVANIGHNFIMEKVTDMTIDDDKLRHTSKTFSEHGLQRTGFKGCRSGPVMNCAACVQNGLILSIYFSRQGGGPLSTVTALLRSLGIPKFYKADSPRLS